MTPWLVRWVLFWLAVAQVLPATAGEVGPVLV
jgi:hypothetical protein